MTIATIAHATPGDIFHDRALSAPLYTSKQCISAQTLTSMATQLFHING